MTNSPDPRFKIHCDSCGYEWYLGLTTVNWKACPECGGELIDGPGDSNEDKARAALASAKEVKP